MLNLVHDDTLCPLFVISQISYQIQEMMTHKVRGTRRSFGREASTESERGGASHIYGLDVEPVLVAAAVDNRVVGELAFLVDETTFVLAHKRVRLHLALQRN